MRSPVRSNSSCVGYSTSNERPTSSAREAPNISRMRSLQSTIWRCRDSTRPIGASSNAVR